MKRKIIEELKKFPKDQKMNEQSKQNILFSLQNEKQREMVNETKKGDVRFMKKLTFGIMSVAMLLIITVVLANEINFKSEQSSMPGDVENSEREEQQGTEKDTETETEEQRSEDANHDGEQTTQEEAVAQPDVEQILSNYKNNFLEVVENAREDRTLEDFQSKQDVIDHFTEIMSLELAQWYVDMYIREKDGELILESMDGPIWFEKDEPYELLKINENNYKVIQQPNNELLGEAKTVFHLLFDGEKWIVNELDTVEANG